MNIESDMAILCRFFADLANTKQCYLIHSFNTSNTLLVYDIEVIGFSVRDVSRNNGLVLFHYTTDYMFAHQRDSQYERLVGVDHAQDMFVSTEAAERSIVLYKLTGKLPTIRELL